MHLLEPVTVFHYELFFLSLFFFGDGLIISRNELCVVLALAVTSLILLCLHLEILNIMGVSLVALPLASVALDFTPKVCPFFT